MPGRPRRVIGELRSGLAKAAGASREARCKCANPTRPFDELAATSSAASTTPAPRRRAGRQRLRAARRADHRVAQLGGDRHRQGALDRRHRYRLGGVPARRPRHLHPPRGSAARRCRSARGGAALRSRQRLPRERQPLHPRFERCYATWSTLRNALGVPLISSDMGKLYVALAQWSRDQRLALLAGGSSQRTLSANPAWT